MNKTKLQSAITAFVKNKKANAAYYDDNWTERKERKALKYPGFRRDETHRKSTLPHSGEQYLQKLEIR